MENTTQEQVIFPYFAFMAKAKKPRAATYDPKLAIDGTFADVIKVSVNYTAPKEKKAAKPAKKAKKK